MAISRIWFLTCVTLALFSALAMSELALAGSMPAKAESKKLDLGVHEFTVTDINGKSKDLKRYKGKILLIVNTASQCGYTPQYQGLQKVYAAYKNKGFEVLGFPSNDFGGQEPGSNKEIQNFCELKYKVSFPMFAKVTVSGAGQAPLFKYLTADAGKELAGPIDWNFEKFLIDPQGKLIARFKSSAAPESPEIISKIESLLKAKQ